MPKRSDIKRVLVIGSGPIVIGQACEFDYSGTQACKALRDEGLEVVLVNSNPATIMTDPEIADRTYVEPLTPEIVAQIIERERPDAVLPTVGGQTALNLAIALAENGTLQKYGVELIGASVDAIKLAEDRLLFRDAMREIGADVPRSVYCRSLDEAMTAVQDIGFPAIIRPSFTMGGVGGGIAYNVEEFRELAGRGLDMSPVHEILLEESIIGWKEFELEVMRDKADNFVVICSIENVDPMGVHTGDSITVAPALTLTDREYQRMRDLGRRIIRRVGVETGGSNIQFAINPENGRIIVIEMNPRVSRSSALASKATGFPIAKIAAKLALGYHLDEIPNDITRLTPASFEPTIDYVVVKVPRWAFEKFPRADRTLTTQMKSVGEVMAIGRTFKEAFMKAFRSLELGNAGLLFGQPVSTGREGLTNEEEQGALQRELSVPNDRRMWALFRALDRGWTVEDLHQATKIDPWFLVQFSEIVELQRSAALVGLRGISPDMLWTLKRAGIADRELAAVLGTDEDAVRSARLEHGIKPAYKRIDTCAAEFESFTPYMYGTYEKEDEAQGALQRELSVPTDRRMWAVFRALERGWTVEELHQATKIDPWFLTQFAQIVELCQSAALVGLRGISSDLLRTLKRAGVGDLELAQIVGADEGAVRTVREEAGLVPAYKRIDTCAAEFESFTPYLYGTYEKECEADPTPRQKVVILGSGPNRIGQGIEFDYC
ncbi:MAG TPA: carbamoyl-phosphate synthase large subunit, partial [Gemmatimonadaceae bacterium]|nr:carbamoyl-phosphate synthase large subunit [Gemmatimonadaceae bacterium]